jgi:hypothetical protein
MESLLVTVAPYSLVAAAVFALLFVVDFVAIGLYVARSGKIDPEEGHVVTENRPLKSGDIAMGGTSAPGGRYWGKHKVFLSRSLFITDKSLVDGTATPAQRRLVNATKLAFVLFGLAWFCGGIAMLPSSTLGGLVFVSFATYWLIWTIRLDRKGRADARRKLKERQASRQNRGYKG